MSSCAVQTSYTAPYGGRPCSQDYCIDRTKDKSQAANLTKPETEKETTEETTDETTDETEKEADAIMERIRVAIEANNVETKERYLSNYRSKEREILSGRTLRSWCGDSPICPNAPAVATDADLIQQWISSAPKVCEALTIGLVKPGSMALTSLGTWNTFLKNVLRRVSGKNTARHIQAHLIRVQRAVDRRIRGEHLDREVKEQLSSFAPDTAVSSADNAARSWKATMLDSEQKQNERHMIQLLEEPLLQPLMKTLFDFLCTSVVPKHYEEYMMMCAIVNQWLSSTTLRSADDKDTRAYRIEKVHSVRSDNPYEAFHWEHAPDVLEQTLESKNHRWFWCTVVHRAGTRQCWMPNVVLSLGGASLEQSTVLMDNVARRQLERNLQVAPMRYFYNFYIHLPFLSDNLLEIIRKEIVVSSSPLPMPEQIPRDPLVIGMLLHTFVNSWLTLDADEQEAQLNSTDEPDVDHTEWYQYVSNQQQRASRTRNSRHH